MTRGKRTCKILKEIRQQIAEKNDIEYITSECTFQGECKGTCPKCEEEVRYLENELRKRQQLGKVVTVAGISLGVAGTFAAYEYTQIPKKQEPHYMLGDIEIVETPKVVRVNFSNITDLEHAPPPDLVTETICVTTGFVIEPDKPEPMMGTVAVISDIDGQIATPNDNELVENIPPPPERYPDVRAEFPGGVQALMKYLTENIEWEPPTGDVGFPGTTVRVEFVVHADGSIDDVKVLNEKQVHQSFAKEVIRVIQSMPKWKPATVNGESVSSYFQMPVHLDFNMRKE